MRIEYNWTIVHMQYCIILFFLIEFQWGYPSFKLTKKMVVTVQYNMEYLRSDIYDGEVHGGEMYGDKASVHQIFLNAKNLSNAKFLDQVSGGRSSHENLRRTIIANLKIYTCIYCRTNLLYSHNQNYCHLPHFSQLAFGLYLIH